MEIILSCQAEKFLDKLEDVLTKEQEIKMNEGFKQITSTWRHQKLDIAVRLVIAGLTRNLISFDETPGRFRVKPAMTE